MRREAPASIHGQPWTPPSLPTTAAVVKLDPFDGVEQLAEMSGGVRYTGLRCRNITFMWKVRGFQHTDTLQFFTELTSHVREMAMCCKHVHKTCAVQTAPGSDERPKIVERWHGDTQT